MSVRSFRCVWLVALIMGSPVVGCAAGSSTDEGSSVDSAVSDGWVTDTGGDETGDSGADTTVVDSGGDVASDADAGKGPCKTNADCVDDPAGKFCLPSTDGGKSFCVPCLPAPFDECPSGSYCSDTTYTCEEGCKTTADCKPAGGGDAGADGSTDGDTDAAGETGSGKALVCDSIKHHCVGCVDDPDCPAGFLCDRPSGACIPGCNAMHPCATGKDCCSGTCVDTKKDAKNCGTCGNTCPTPSNATAACLDGTCGIGMCNTGYGDCNTSAADGCETNTQTNKDNCGACGTVCALANATAACTSGSCTIATCNGGYDDCDKIASTGCETSLKSSDNCGMCGKLCTVPNGTGTCATGTCLVATCNTGYGDCDGLPANGCETNTSGGTPGPGSTILNCGTCGTSCSVANGTPLCSSGTCQVGSCTAPYADCDGTYSNGCETNVNNNVNNCGGCGTKCSTTHGSPSCTSGSCAISCDPGFGNCDSSVLTGCETDTKTDINNCGACGTKCSLTSHALTTACGSSACGITSCDSEWYDRDKIYSNGCECQDDLIGGTCGGAMDLGTIPLGGTKTQTGNLAGESGSDANDEDWFKITFATAASCSYHPRVALTGDANVKFEVYTSCAGSTASGSYACGGGTEASTSISAPATSWEFTMPSGTCGDLLARDPTPATGSFITTSTVIYVRVRRTGSTGTCYPYTLSIGN